MKLEEARMATTVSPWIVMHGDCCILIAIKKLLKEGGATELMLGMFAASTTLTMVIKTQVAITTTSTPPVGKPSLATTTTSTALKSTSTTATTVTSTMPSNIECNGTRVVVGGGGLGSSRISLRGDVRSPPYLYGLAPSSSWAGPLENLQATNTQEEAMKEGIQWITDEPAAAPFSYLLLPPCCKLPLFLSSIV